MPSIRSPLAPTRIGSSGLHRLRLAQGVGQPVVLADERGGRLAQEAADDLDRLLEPGDSLAHGRQVDAVLLVLVDLPPGPDAEDEAAAADVVGRRRHVGQHRRVAVGVAVDEGADAHPGDGGAQGGDHRSRLQGRDVAAVPDPALPMKWSATQTPSHPVASAWRAVATTSAQGWLVEVHTEKRIAPACPDRDFARGSGRWSDQIRGGNAVGGAVGGSAHEAEEAPHLVDEQLGLLPGGEVAAAVERLVPAQVGVAALGPAA